MDRGHPDHCALHLHRGPSIAQSEEITTISEEANDQLIQVLPDALANKIAAGEVVQRPASVVKELLENAVDAGAGHIDLIIQKAGSELIRVIDNGCGMSAEDAPTCFLRHATSKISSIEDLERIRTLGFRGEAMASIAAVAQVELKTKRREDEAATRIRIEGSEIVETGPTASPDGTSISVRNLFYNVPARRNFLKSTATEFKHILDTFQFISLSNPKVGFSLTHDGTEMYRLPKPQSGGEHSEALKARIIGLFGNAAEAFLVPVQEETSYISIDGFVAKPTFSKRTRGQQFLFVNGRYIKSRYLDHAVMSGFGEMLPKGSYPFFTLFLKIDPRHVDVNVHPTKAEVKFDDERGMYGIIRAVVKRALGGTDIAPGMSFTRDGILSEHKGMSGPSRLADDQSYPVHPTELPDFARSFRNATSGQGLDLAHALLRPSNSPDSSSPIELNIPASNPDPAEQAEDRLIWQLHEKYVLTRIRSGLMVLDQHAAHERILYEKGIEAMESGLGMSQQLLFPHSIDLAPPDFALVSELMDDFRSLGFDIETFGGNSVVVRGVPADIAVGDEREILEEIIQQYKEYESSIQIKGRDNLAKSLACKSAIKTGKRLSIQEMQTLIDQLFMCDMPYSCPHGRPTMIKLSIDELDKRFGRVGHLERD